MTIQAGNQPALFDVETPKPQVRARARRTDPQTSHDAADSIGEKQITDLQQTILILFHDHGPMHDAVLIPRVAGKYYLKKQHSDSSVRSRRAELVARGMLRDSGKRFQLASGRQSIIWELV
jgi:hypothetical protein